MLLRSTQGGYCCGARRVATAAEHAGWLLIRDDVLCSSIIRVHMQHSRAQHSAFFARWYETLSVLDSLLERKIEKVPFRDSSGEVFVQIPAEHAGWLPVRDDAPCSSLIRVYVKHRPPRGTQEAIHIFGSGTTVHLSREGTLSILDSLLARKI